MIVRLANFDTDALDLLEASMDFVGRMAFQEFASENFAETVARNMTADFVEVAVAEDDGRIVGCLGMSYLPFFWNPEKLSAEELFFWTAKDAPKTAALRLIRFTMDRIRTRGRCLATFRRLETSPGALDRVYRKIGLQPVETTYMGVI